MKKINLLLSMAIFLFVASCATVDIGIVTKKEYKPPYHTASIILAGKTRVPTTHYHPEKWVITIYGKRSDYEEGDKLYYGNCSVSEAEYNRVMIHQEYRCR